MPSDFGEVEASTHELGHRRAAQVRDDPAAIGALSQLLGLSEDEVGLALAATHGRTLVRNVFKVQYALAAGEPVEDYDDEGPTGIEQEVELDTKVERPYDPDKIRVDPKTFSLFQVMEDIKAGDIDLAPDFQRQSVWGPRQKVRLVESVLLRIPLPAFYFSADKAGRLSVVDGVQRLSALHEFFTGGFSLTRADLEYLSVDTLRRRGAEGDDPDRCAFADLDGLWTRRMRQTQFTTYVIDPQTPEQVKFDIFKRINTGGSPLNAQEIRHSMMSSRARDLLRELSQSQAFRAAVPEGLWDHPRMADREAILRFLAFAMLEDVQQYPDTTMDAFLVAAAKRLDDPSDVDDAMLDALRAQFGTAMDNASFLFGEHAFRKWPVHRDDRKFPFNKALFESIGLALSRVARSKLEPHKPAIVQAARELMAEPAFVEAITVSTGDLSKVQTRFLATSSLLARYA